MVISLWEVHVGQSGADTQTFKHFYFRKLEEKKEEVGIFDILRGEAEKEGKKRTMEYKDDE